MTDFSVYCSFNSFFFYPLICILIHIAFYSNAFSAQPESSALHSHIIPSVTPSHPLPQCTATSCPPLIPSHPSSQLQQVGTPEMTEHSYCIITRTHFNVFFHLFSLCLIAMIKAPTPKPLHEQHFKQEIQRKTVKPSLLVSVKKYNCSLCEK